MRIIVDCQALRLYPVAQTGFTGMTETYARRIARGLAAAGHEVHVVAPDLDDDERRGPNEWWWSPANHPSRADVVVAVHSLAFAEQYTGDALVVASNGAEVPGLDDRIASLVAAFPVLSRTHGELLCRLNPGVDPGRVVVTGLGVDLDEYPLCPTKVPGRLWVGNDPSRGLWHVLDVLERVQARVPAASLAISYDFDTHFERFKWHQNAASEMLWECKRRMATLPNVLDLGALDHAGVVQQQLAAQVHVWPSDPANVGTQLHGGSQLEAAAAGCALVLSDVEAFPEVFGEAAVVLPTIGTFFPDRDGEDGTRVGADDYAEEVVELVTDPAAWDRASRASRALAERNTWSAVVDRWCALVDQLMGVPA